MQDINTLCRVNSSLLYSGLIEQFGHPNNFKNTIYTNISEQNTPYITFAPFSNSDVVKQAFSTRLGGVSTGMFWEHESYFQPCRTVWGRFI